LRYGRTTPKAVIFRKEPISYVPKDMRGWGLGRLSKYQAKQLGKTLIPAENIAGLSPEWQVITPVGSYIQQVGKPYFTIYGKQVIQLISARVLPAAPTAPALFKAPTLDIGKYAGLYAKGVYSIPYSYAGIGAASLLGIPSISRGISRVSPSKLISSSLGVSAPSLPSYAPSGISRGISKQISSSLGVSYKEPSISPPSYAPSYKAPSISIPSYAPSYVPPHYAPPKYEPPYTPPPPEPPPEPPPQIYQILPFGALLPRPKRYKRKPRKRKYKYAPSLAAVVLDIRAPKPPKLREIKGLEIRPVIRARRRRRK
jgi:hypothetical protein